MMAKAVFGIDEIKKVDNKRIEAFLIESQRTIPCTQIVASTTQVDSIIRLDLDSTQETRGIQVVGNYGTGKSHLMSLFSIIAEDAHYLDFLNNQ